MLLQAWIIYVGDLRLALHELRNCLGIFVLLLHADDDRLEASFHQPAGLGVEASSKYQGALAYLFGELLVGDSNACTKVAMATNVFCGAVRYDVYSQVDRVLIYR